MKIVLMILAVAAVVALLFLLFRKGLRFRPSMSAALSSTPVLPFLAYGAALMADHTPGTDGQPSSLYQMLSVGLMTLSLMMFVIDVIALLAGLYELVVNRHKRK